MATDKPRAKRKVRSVKSVREQANKEPVKQKKQGRVRRTLAVAARPLHRVRGKEYYLPLPDNRAGNLLNKRRSFMPSYFKNAYLELKQVAWPSRKQTWQLTLAVFIFAIIFGVAIAITDFGLDKIFKRILL